MPPYAKTNYGTRTVDRVLLGKAPANSRSTYHRSDEYGLFVSKPGANVMDCNSSSLIFDSTTSHSLSQVLGQGFTYIPGANSAGLQDIFGVFDVNHLGEKLASHTGNVIVYTGISAPIWPQANTPLLCWLNYQDANATHITNWPQMAAVNGHISIGGNVGIMCKSYVNTLAGNTVDLKFDNGLISPVAAYWTLYKDPGATPGEGHDEEGDE